MNRLALFISLFIGANCLFSAHALAEEKVLTEPLRWQVEAGISSLFQKGFPVPVYHGRVNYLLPLGDNKWSVGTKLGFMPPVFADSSISGGLDTRLDVKYHFSVPDPNQHNFFLYAQPGLQYLFSGASAPELRHIPFTLGGGGDLLLGNFGLTGRLGVDLSTLVQNKIKSMPLVELEAGVKVIF